jgi:segregation and condensation protein B
MSEQVDEVTENATSAEKVDDVIWVEDAREPELEADGREATEEPEELGLGAPSLGAALEALLLLADEPMAVMDLASAVRRPADEVEEELRSLSAEYSEAGRGFDLREVAGGWRYYTRAECSPLVERYVLDGQQARLTQASLETLAVIAYRQPITRGRVSAVRGVNVDGVIRTLLTRGLIAEAGHDGESGAHLYVTTSHFLERMGIASLTDLPPLAEHLPDLADLEDVLDSVATGE